MTSQTNVSYTFCRFPFGSFSLNLFILHRLWNKLSAYINHARCLLPGDLNPKVRNIEHRTYLLIINIHTMFQTKYNELTNQNTRTKKQKHKKKKVRTRSSRDSNQSRDLWYKRPTLYLCTTNRMTSHYDVILQKFGFITSGKSKNPYKFLFELVLEIDDECYYTQIITHKITCACSFIVYVLSYLIISSRSFFCFDIFFSSNENVRVSWLHITASKSSLWTQF